MLPLNEGLINLAMSEISTTKGNIMNDFEKFKEMTNAQLDEFCNDLGIEVKAKGKKPNKAEYMTAIASYYGINTEEPEDETADEADKIIDKLSNNFGKKEKKESEKKKQLKELMVLRRVQISSNKDNQKDPSNLNIAHTVSWGNRLVGYYTDRFILNRPWHIREGALRNLKNATFRKSVVNPSTHETTMVTVPMYNIAELPPLTEEEIKEMAAKQKTRNAAVDIANEASAF
jgi:hypothetical protein